MAGGRGSRLGGVDKPLLKICGERIIDHAVKEAKKISHRKIIICTKKEYMDELVLLREYDVEILECLGRDYVEDLNIALSKIEFPALILPADTPFITSEIINRFIEEAGKNRSDIITLMRCRENICVETGVSLFNKSSGGWRNIYFIDSIELLDIDTREDLLRAEKQCEYMEELEKRE